MDKERESQEKEPKPIAPSFVLNYFRKKIFGPNVPFRPYDPDQDEIDLRNRDRRGLPKIEGRKKSVIPAGQPEETEPITEYVHESEGEVDDNIKDQEAATETPAETPKVAVDQPEESEPITEYVAGSESEIKTKTPAPAEPQIIPEPTPEAETANIYTTANEPPQIDIKYLPRDPDTLQLATRWTDFIAQTRRKEETSQTQPIKRHERKGIKKELEKLEQIRKATVNSEEGQITASKLNPAQQNEIADLEQKRVEAFALKKYDEAITINNQIKKLVGATQSNPEIRELPETKREVKERIAAETPIRETFANWVEENDQPGAPTEMPANSEEPKPEGTTDLGDREIVYDKDYEFVQKLKDAKVRVKHGTLEIGEAENVVFEIEDGALVGIKEPKPEGTEEEQKYGAQKCVFNTYGSGDIDLPKNANLGNNDIHHKQ